MLQFKKRSSRDLSKPFVKNSHIFALGGGDLGYSLISCTVATYIMTYGTMAIGISGTLMGLAIAIGTIFDAISDPIVGYISDNFSSKKFGKRHLFMLVGLIGIMISSFAIWYVPTNWSQIGMFFWFMIWLILLRTFNTFYFTPVGAFSVEVSNDYNERTTIQTIRSIFYIIGMIAPVIIMGSFQNKHAVIDSATGEVLIKGQFVAAGYKEFAIVAIAICFVTTIFLMVTTFSDIKMVQARDAKLNANNGPRIKKTLREVIKDFFSVLKIGNMRSIIFGYAISMISATLIIAIGFHVFTFTFVMSTTQMYILMGGLLGMTILGQPLWAILAKKLDKRKSLLIGLSICLLGCALIIITYIFRAQINGAIAKSATGLLYLLPGLMLAGLGTGVLYSMPLALIGDVVVQQSSDGSSEQTGTYAGMMTFAYKVSQSLTTAIAGVLLDVIGFQEGSTVQSPKTADGLGLMLCIGTTVAIVIGLIIFSTMKIDKAQITKMMADKENGINNSQENVNNNIENIEICEDKL